MNEILKKRIETRAVGIGLEFRDAIASGGSNRNAAEAVATLTQTAANWMAEWLLKHLWISVDEALPEYEECVLAHFEGEDEVGEMFSQRSKPSDNLILDKNGFQVVGFTEVTYWMPIPELKGGEK